MVFEFKDPALGLAQFSELCTGDSLDFNSVDPALLDPDVEAATGDSQIFSSIRHGLARPHEGDRSGAELVRALAWHIQSLPVGPELETESGNSPCSSSRCHLTVQQTQLSSLMFPCPQQRP